MEMPESCLDCFVCHVLSDEGLYCEPLDTVLEPDSFGRLANCPIIPVPAHGRLGDLDEIVRYKERLVVDADKINPKIRYVVDTKYIEEAPTIIPEDHEEEEMK
jgi:hypothetical protein